VLTGLATLAKGKPRSDFGSSLVDERAISGKSIRRRAYSGVALPGLAGLEGSDELHFVNLQRFSPSMLRTSSSLWSPPL